MACEDVQAKPYEEEAPKKEVQMREGKLILDAKEVQIREGKLILDAKKIREVIENEEKKNPANEPAEVDEDVEKDEKVQKDKPKTKSPSPNEPSQDKDKDHVDSMTVDIYEMAGPKAKKPVEPKTAIAPSPKAAKKGGKTPRKKSKRTPHSKTPKKKKSKKKSHRKKKHR